MSVTSFSTCSQSIDFLYIVSIMKVSRAKHALPEKAEIRYNKLRKLKIAEKVDTACRSLVE